MAIKISRNVKFVKKQGLIYISCMNLSYHYSRNFRIRTPTVIVVGTLACGMFAFSTNIYISRKKNVKNLYQYFIQKYNTGDTFLRQIILYNNVTRIRIVTIFVAIRFAIN